MANLKISELQAGAPAQADDMLPIARAGENYSLPVSALIDAVWPVGSIYTAVVDTNPGTLLGVGTWAAFGAGRVLVGLDAGDTDFDTAEEAGGTKTVAAVGAVSQPTFAGQAANLAHSGTAIADHTINQVLNHTHAVNVTDPQHNHTQNAHTHVQDAHSHIITSQTATTGGATSYEHGTLDTSSAEAEATETTATAVAVNQNATATNQAASTGITATTSNPAGGVASITLVHGVTQPNAHAYTPAGTVSQPTFTGTPTSVVQPYVTVYFWKRTA